MDGLLGLPSNMVLEMACTLLAALFFALVGFRLRRYAGTIKRNRPMNECLPIVLAKRTRPCRVKHFLNVATGVLQDAHGSLLDGVREPASARALIPIVADVRQHGERLLASQAAIHWVLAPLYEPRLAPLVRELIALEGLLKSLPRPQLSLEDVLAGNFEEGLACFSRGSF